MSTWEVVAILLLIAGTGCPIVLVIKGIIGRITFNQVIVAIFFWIAGSGAAVLSLAAIFLCMHSCNTNHFPLRSLVAGYVGLFLYGFCFMVLFTPLERERSNPLEVLNSVEASKWRHIPIIILIAAVLGGLIMLLIQRGSY